MLYHADVIGSLLRPRYLSEARAALAAGRISNTEFKRIEDRAVDQAIAMQEACGLDVVNDGELRRFSFLDHLLGDMEGVADMPGRAGALPRPGSGPGLELAPAVHRHRPDPAQGADDDHRGVQLRARPGPRPGEDHDAEPAGHVRRVVTGAFPPGLLRSVRAVRRRRRHHPRRGRRTGPARLHLHPDRLARPRHAGRPGEPRAARGPGHGHRTHASPRAWTSSTPWPTCPG